MLDELYHRSMTYGRDGISYDKYAPYDYQITPFRIKMSLWNPIRGKNDNANYKI